MPRQRRPGVARTTPPAGVSSAVSKRRRAELRGHQAYICLTLPYAEQEVNALIREAEQAGQDNRQPQRLKVTVQVCVLSLCLAPYAALSAA